METRPPIYTTVDELVGWTLDRTASIPKGGERGRISRGREVSYLNIGQRGSWQ
jgi:hypothetical protein